jgi:hypothetical protein
MRALKRYMNSPCIPRHKHYYSLLVRKSRSRLSGPLRHNITPPMLPHELRYQSSNNGPHRLCDIATALPVGRHGSSSRYRILSGLCRSCRRRECPGLHPANTMSFYPSPNQASSRCCIPVYARSKCWCVVPFLFTELALTQSLTGMTFSLMAVRIHSARAQEVPASRSAFSFAGWPRTTTFPSAGSTSEQSSVNHGPDDDKHGEKTEEQPSTTT